MDTTSNQNKKSGTSATDKATESAESSKKYATEQSAASALAESSQGAESTSDKKNSETDKEGPLFKFFTDTLKDMYYAEKRLLEVLPKMQKAATTEELQDAFEDHHLQTQKHVSRMEKVFRLIGEQPEAKKCDAMEGLVKEAEKCIEDTKDGSLTRDAALIISAQKVEHYEIASYGGLCALAETLGEYDASELLHVTLEEETKTDNDLTHIAESFINFYASEDGSSKEKAATYH